MHNRFTDRARRIMQLAASEARRLNHEYISTEHLLLGLLKASRGVGVAALTNLHCDPAKVIQELERLTLPGPLPVTMRNLPQTPRASRAIEGAIEEARSLNHQYVGSEHILLGLLRDKESTSSVLLSQIFGLELEPVRAEVLRMLRPGSTDGKGHSLGA
jgi:ATP-dependent Clp protease ATP-binding subunit ClpC